MITVIVIVIAHRHERRVQRAEADIGDETQVLSDSGLRRPHTGWQQRRLR
jgi:hypothetical protein